MPSRLPGGGGGTGLDLAAADVDWRDALHVLYRSRPRVRSHIGAVLRIIAPARERFAAPLTPDTCPLMPSPNRRA